MRVLIVVSPGALGALLQRDIADAIARHKSGDWGNVYPEDRAANNLAIVEGTRLLSAYSDNSGNEFFIITEADRSRTTVLLSTEY